jgi:glutaredoxin|tara:strand:+ start:39 stop:281 length:243 start_codon:yes stop_codon:yes gene_type:complete
MITIYSRPGCKYCDLSKTLLEVHNCEYNELMLEVDITVDQLRELVPGAKSVPQIMDDNIHIGGYNELVEYLNRPAGARRC